MRLNPSPSRFFIKHSEIFEAGIDQLLRRHPLIGEALDDLEDALLKVPYSEGEPTPVFEGRHFRIRLSPKTRRYPALRVLYEIEEPRVVCWHICERH